MIVYVDRVVEHIHHQMVIRRHIDGSVYNVKVGRVTAAVAYLVCGDRFFEEIYSPIFTPVVVIEIEGEARPEDEAQTVGGI